MNTPGIPAVFLDRDDTLIACRSLPEPPPPGKAGDLVDAALVRLLPGVAAAVGALRSAGFGLVVVTNQGLVARGAGTMKTVEAVNARMLELLEQSVPTGTPRPVIEKIYVCPYHPLGTVAEYVREHEWRKPAGGMVRAAAQELGLDLAGSWLIGDAERDVLSGIDGGLLAERCLRIGEGERFSNLGAAADHLLAEIGAISTERSTLTLRALAGSPLDDPATREAVVVHARGLGERAGLVVEHVEVSAESIVMTVRADRLTGLGFLAELRRETNAWYEARYHDGPLWGTPPPGWEFEPT